MNHIVLQNLPYRRNKEYTKTWNNIFIFNTRLIFLTFTSIYLSWNQEFHSKYHLKGNSSQICIAEQHSLVFWKRKPFPFQNYSSPS